MFVSQTQNIIAYEITHTGGKAIDVTFSLSLHDKFNSRTPTAVSKLPDGINEKYENYFMYFSARSDNGSEFGAEGDKSDLDYKLRPCIDEVDKTAHGELVAHIRKLSEIKRGSKALCYGSYEKATLQNKNFSFVREWEGEKIIVAINISEGDCTVRVEEAEGVDLLTGQVRNLNDIYLPPFTAAIYRKN